VDFGLGSCASEAWGGSCATDSLPDEPELLARSLAAVVEAAADATIDFESDGDLRTSA
jgi:hypothetical protein